MLVDLLRVTLDQYRDACLYTRIRRFSGCGSVLWPIMIGLETLELLAGNDALDPAKPAKVPRKRVYRIMASSLALVGSNAAIRARLTALADAVSAHLAQAGHALIRTERCRRDRCRHRPRPAFAGHHRPPLASTKNVFIISCRETWVS